jgi:phosphatidylinositol-3-phosphatase
MRAATVRGVRRGALRFGVVAVGVLACCASLPTIAWSRAARGAAAPALRIAYRPHGIVVTFTGRLRRGVVFVVDGTAVARDRRAPYRLVLRYAAKRGGSHAVVVRGFVTGRRLAGARLVLSVAATTARRRAVGRVRRVASGVGPAVWITTAPGDVSTSRTALFAWRVRAAGGAVTVCRVDRGAVRRCTSPLRVRLRRRGAHRFRVRLVATNGSVVASANWRVVGRVAGRPVVLDRAWSSPSGVALFSFAAPTGARAECRLDAAPARPCSSPIGYLGLSEGRHVFAITTTTSAGSVTAYAGWSVLGSTAGSPPPPPPPPSPRSGPCGTAAAAPATYAHVVWIVMENHGYGEVLDPAQAPYTAGLAAACGVATDFFAERHPSLPNYIAMTSGSTQGITDDADPSSHPLAVPSIFSQTNGDWRALEESMPSTCDHTNAGNYAVRHNPAAYYTTIAAECSSRDVPLGAAPDISARFTFITPNLQSDTHDTSVGYGDAWLAAFLPKLFASSAYTSGTTAVFLTWDEDDGSSSNHIATLVIAPSVPAGTRVATPFTHYSMLRTTEEMLAIPTFLGNAATASSMRTAFHA